MNINLFQHFFLNDRFKSNLEKIIVYVAIASFLVHLIFIGLVDFDLIDSGAFNELFISPLSAIYTPFSIILIYEVYLLVFYIPKSITNYIGKQYEIITLILIRKLFYDLSKLEFSSNWFSISGDLEFTIDIIATLVLFALILGFYSINKQLKTSEKEINHKTKTYIKVKKILASVLVPIIAIIAIYSFTDWFSTLNLQPDKISQSIKSVNNVFFDEFFTILIIVDVLLLLFSFLQTDEFSRVIRNSGFIISTILIKLSFSASGILNAILIVVAVSFGVLILLIYKSYQKRLH